MVVGASANPLPPAKRSTVTPVASIGREHAAALLDLDQIGGGSQAAFERALEVVVGRGGCGTAWAGSGAAGVVASPEH